MQISHKVPFEFELNLSQEAAIEFVRDVELSLSKAEFIRDLFRYTETDLGHDYVTANIPINAAMFGQHKLAFQSLLIPTENGARLQELPLDTPTAGWAEVAGEAVVSAQGESSLVRYDFDITIHLQLPTPEKWGGRALIKMIEFTAQQVLTRVAEEFPRSVQAAAKEVEAAYSVS